MVFRNRPSTHFAEADPQVSRALHPLFDRATKRPPQLGALRQRGVTHPEIFEVVGVAFVQIAQAPAFLAAWITSRNWMGLEEIPGSKGVRRRSELVSSGGLLRPTRE